MQSGLLNVAADGVVNNCRNLHKLMQGAEGVEMLLLEDFPGKAYRFRRYTHDLNIFYDKRKGLDFDIMHINGFSSYSVHQAFKAAQLFHKQVVYTDHFQPFNKNKHLLGLKVFNDLLTKPY
jgi:hypothetical protein